MNLQIKDSDGTIVHPTKQEFSAQTGGRSKLTFDKLKPGWYSVETAYYGTPASEKVIGLLPGSTHEEQLETQQPDTSRLADEVMDGAGGHARHDDCAYCVAIQDSVKSGQTSAFLAVIGDAASRGRASDGHERLLERVGLKDINIVAEQKTTGLQVLLAAELGNRPVARDFAAKAELRFWKLGKPPGSLLSLTGSTRVSGLAGLKLSAEAGPHWLSLHIPDRKEVVLALTLRQGFLTRVLLLQEPDGVVKIFQYMVSQALDGPPSPAAIRLLDAVERFLIEGSVTDAFKTLKELPFVSAPPIPTSRAEFWIFQRTPTRWRR